MKLVRNSVALSICAGLGGLLAMTPAFSSVLLASDNFNTYATSGLNGQNGGTGWGGAWVDANPVNANVVAVGGLDAPMIGNGVRFTGNSDAAATRTLATALDGNIIVNFDFQFDAGTISNNDFMGLWFGSSTGPNIGLKANCGGVSGCTADIFARTSGTDAGGSFQNIVLGTSYRVMGYLQKTGTSLVYNRFDLWVNPTASEIANLTGSDAFDTGTSSISSFNMVGFRTANLSNTATADALLVDNLTLNRVPEPGTLALVGLALAGIGAMLRRRKL